MGSISICRGGAVCRYLQTSAKSAIWLAAALMLGACQTEDTGVRAARMEAQDDTACKARQDYQQCRSNIMVYRREALREEAQRRIQARQFGEGLQDVGRALQGTQNVNVTVSCKDGPGTC
jgi:hypothetical protein